MLLIMLALMAAAKPAASHPEQYNVVWDSPSADSSGSMPLGNGDIGVNAWCEPSGDICFYISKTDAWSGNAQLLKLGKVRVRFAPSLYPSQSSFRQELKIDVGALEIATDAGSARLWVDAKNPAIRFECTTKKPCVMDVELEIWRKEKREIEGKELTAVYGISEGPSAVFATPDTVLEKKGAIVWYHRNEESIWKDSMTLQGMGAWAENNVDPLLGRTFGGLLEGTGLETVTATHVRSSEPRTAHDFVVVPVTAQAATAEGWLAELEGAATKIRGLKVKASFAEHRTWWKKFWDRSWIVVSGDPEAETVSRGYALQRYVSACAGRGAFPIKFNGSIFTVDSREKEECYDADYRRWGGPYWFQNTRLAYWPMLAGGDFDMMDPLFKMFLDALPFCRERTQTYFNHAGAFYPETMYFWGGYANDNYGWNREGKTAAQVDNTYIRWHWEGQLELLALALDRYRFTEDPVFAKKTLLKLAEPILDFFDEHYPRDAGGKLLMQPGQALETWQNAVNPLPEIAGLMWVLDGLLGLPRDLVPAELRTQWERLRKEVPPLPQRGVKAHAVLSPARDILSPKGNSENPELYAVFPFRLFGVGKPDLEMARRTFNVREVRGNNGWRQDDTQAAFLGRTDIARRYMEGRFANKHAGSRFPAFWGPNFDWIPDQDHGCNGLMALQTMLLQHDGDKLFLLPAWPKDWNVSFKLHAPENTVVKGRFARGKLEWICVTPESRRAGLTVIEYPVK